MIELRELSTEENDFIDLLRDYKRANAARKDSLQKELHDMIDEMGE